MHTILGAGGAVSNALQKEIEGKNEKLRLISRREIITSNNTSWRKADLLDLPALRKEAKGSTVIYLCVGIVYDAKIWAAEWPIIMQHAITIAEENNARLLFFDNVYMYGKVEGAMKENTPYNPISKKGEIRAKIAEKMETSWKAGNIKGSISRAADFYNANTANSFFDMLVLKPMTEGKKASWIGNPNAIHSFTHVNEAAHGMFLLGRDEKTDNQIWHLPTAEPMNGIQFIETAAKALHAKSKFSKINYFMLSLASLGDKNIRSVLEMYYQFKYDYNFNSEKFNNYFSYSSVSYLEGFSNFKSK